MTDAHAVSDGSGSCSSELYLEGFGLLLFCSCGHLLIESCTERKRWKMRSVVPCPIVFFTPPSTTVTYLLPPHYTSGSRASKSVQIGLEGPIEKTLGRYDGVAASALAQKLKINITI